MGSQRFARNGTIRRTAGGRIAPKDLLYRVAGYEELLGRKFVAYTGFDVREDLPLRSFAKLVLFLAVLSPFVALFIGPILAGGPAGIWLVVGALWCAFPAGAGAVIALAALPADEKAGQASGRSSRANKRVAAWALFLGITAPIFLFTIGRSG